MCYKKKNIIRPPNKSAYLKIIYLVSQLMVHKNISFCLNELVLLSTQNIMYMGHDVLTSHHVVVVFTVDDIRFKSPIQYDSNEYPSHVPSNSGERQYK